MWVAPVITLDGATAVRVRRPASPLRLSVHRGDWSHVLTATGLALSYRTDLGWWTESGEVLGALVKGRAT